MHLEKEDLEKKQDEVADELCTLLERAGRGGESSRRFEIPEYARRRIDISPSKGKITGHFKSLVITDWKRKDHQEGNVPEERIVEENVLAGVALILKKNNLRVFCDKESQDMYVLGIERYEGIPVQGLEDGHLYKLYSPGHTTEAWEVTSDGETITSRAAEMEEETLTLVTNHGERVKLEPFDQSEEEYVNEMKKKSEGGN